MGDMKDARTPPLTGHPFKLAEMTLLARPSGALWVPSIKTLVVSDLHLGKAERNARRGGGLWPPYENDETLSRLEAETKALLPDTIITLGDSFDDPTCVDAMADTDHARIKTLAERHRLIWITGNHDPAPTTLPGDAMDELILETLTLRHIAKRGVISEISGHYHPKVTIQARGRKISRKCFIFDTNRLILPAFGAYTGGLDVLTPSISSLFDEAADVILTGNTALRAPVARLRQLAA